MKTSQQQNFEKACTEPDFYARSNSTQASKIINVWFPTREEWEQRINFLKENKGIKIKPLAKDIILNHYYKTLKKLKPMDMTKCPHCKTTLIQGRKESRVYYRCPKWKPNNQGCPGIIRKDIKTQIEKGYVSWIGNCESELKEQNVTMTREEIYKFLDIEGLDSPTKIWKEKMTSLKGFNGWLSTEYKSGWQIAQKNSKEQELRILKDLQIDYGEMNVKYQPHIFFMLENDKRIHHRTPDFLIFLEDKILIREAKKSSWDVKDNQKEDYIKLLRFMYPEKRLDFEYIFEKENEVYDADNGVNT